VTVTSFSIPSASLDDWKARLRSRASSRRRAAEIRGASILVTDPSGLVIELVGTDRDTRAPWGASGVSTDAADARPAQLTMTVRDPVPR